MRTTILAFLTLLLLATAGAVPPQGDAGAYPALKAQAEKEYAEKSFQRAHDLYAEAAKLALSPADTRWVELRLADTLWRANSENGDEARRRLEALIRDMSVESRDRVWAEANESLGDLTSGTNYYVAALDWWAGQDDLALARRRYLDLVWKLTPNAQTWSAPREVLVNAVKIAESPDDRAHARFLLAQQLANEGRPASIERAIELLEEVIAIGKKSEWYDDALMLAAASYARYSPVDVMSTGENVETGPNYEKALELLRRLLAEFKPDETSYDDEARSLIREITDPTIGAQVAGTFLPDVEQKAVLSWRNVRQIELTLFAVDLTKDAAVDPNRNWIQAIRTEGREVVRRWTHETNDKGTHQPGMAEIALTPRLAPGAYVLIARNGKTESRALVLVTDAHILVHSGGDRMHVFVSHVLTGEPMPNARVRVQQWQGARRGDVTVTTNASGVAEAKIGDGGAVLITAAAGSHQAFHQTWAYNYRNNDARQWRIYAFTDRPAYRPNETVQWKIIARMRDGEQWTTPASQTLAYEITSPRGEKVATGTAKLTEFGSFWAELPLTPSMALGAYTVTFKLGTNYAGSAQLFRLEEYKLPEFVVRVTTPEGQQYRLGETIEATVEASYYFGGPVTNAEVEVVVHQSPFRRYWTPWREYDWYWRGWIAPPPPESVVTTEHLRTDAAGRAVLHIDTPRDGSDTQYRLEARVVDASRREVRGEGTVRVMRQRYSVLAAPEHYIHRPGESASVKFKAMDANDKPVQVTGTVKVVQRRWHTDVLRGGRYDEDEVLTAKLTTDAAGEATMTFTPKTTGYFAVRWTSTDGDSRRAQDVVTAETTIWVAEKSSTDLGYFYAGGLQLIVDKESVRVGQTASVLVVTPSSGRWVMVTSFGDDILDTQVLKLDGNVKLVQIPIGDRHVPNFFVTASSIFNRELATQTERLVVPPVEHFLTVEVKADREDYEPRQEGTYTVTTRDASGKPVAAEVAVAVSDEAVTAIQQDTAGDPRPFFFGDLREQRLQVSAGVQSQRYITKEDEQRARDEEKRMNGLAKSRKDGFAYGVEGGVVGGVVGGYARDSVAQSITVTAAAPTVMNEAMAPPPPPAPVPQAGAKEESAQAIDVQVRTDFRSTALWKPNVITDASGTATVKLKFPEALTTWRATARAATKGSSFGMATSTARTNLPLLVRLQAPRFFVVGDRVTVSAVMNNNTDAAMTVTPSLDVEGPTLSDKTAAPLTVPAHGEARADWTVVAEKSGEAKLRVAGRSSTRGDAMEKSFVVYEHGIDKLIAKSGKLRGDEAIVKLELPRERRATDLTVQIAPSLAVTMLDALPYLIEYPYGCTEQTMSRFLPAAIVARTLEKLHLGRARIAGKDLDAVTAKGMARLYDFQHSDGGWGWWKDGSSDDFMTAYVVWGFAIARDGGLPVNASSVDRAIQWLETQLVKNENQWSDQAWMLHAMSAWHAKPSDAERRAYDDVWAHRERLTAYSRALLALTAHRYGDTERTTILVRNLEDGATIDRTPDSSILLKGETASETMATAHWGAKQFWWRWYEGPVETTAFVLQALVTIDPQNKLVEPAMNWLVKNRRGAQWNNTRDTAIAILAFNDYLQRSGELAGDVSYELTVNGKTVATKKLTAADVLGAPSRFHVDAAFLNDTTQEIRIRRTDGKSPLYFSAEARFVSLEEPIKAAGNEIFVKRQYFRLKPRPTLLKGILYDRVPLRDGESVASGERIDVVVTVESKNDYDYLLFEDLKPAGFEAVELQSGQPLWATNVKTKTNVWVYQELRDRKVAMFIDHLEQGVWELSYALRAETPGSFHALPLLGQAMYVPEIRANGDEVRVVVTER